MLSAIEAAETVEALTELLQRFVESRGFSGFAFMDAGSPLQGIPFSVGTSGEAWEEEYRSNRFFQVDPCVDLARRTNKPFLWSDISLPAKAGGRKSGALKTMEAALDHRFTNGGPSPTTSPIISAASFPVPASSSGRAGAKNSSRSFPAPACGRTCIWSCSTGRSG